MEMELHLLDRKYEALRVRNPRNEARLVAALADNLEVSPVVVVESQESPGRYVLIDGHKRVRAAQRLAKEVIDAVVWQHSEVDALVLVHNLQRARERSALEDAYLVEVLHQDYGLSLGAIGHKLGRTRSWVSRRLGLVKQLPAWLQERVRQGQLQCHAAQKYFVPLARANTHDAELLARNIIDLGLSSRQIGELYRAWLQGDEDARDLVVSQPQTVLRATDAVRRSSTADDSPSGLLLQDVHRLCSIAQRAERALDRALLDGIGGKVARRVLTAWTQTQAAIAKLQHRISKEVKDDD